MNDRTRLVRRGTYRESSILTTTMLYLPGFELARTPRGITRLFFPFKPYGDSERERGRGRMEGTCSALQQGTLAIPARFAGNSVTVPGFAQGTRPAPGPTPRFPGTGHSVMIWLHERLWNAPLQRSLYPVIDGLKLENRGFGEFTSFGHYHHRRFSDDVRFRGLLGFSPGFQGHEGLFFGRQYPALVCARCIERIRHVRYRRHHVAGLSALHLRS